MCSSEFLAQCISGQTGSLHDNAKGGNQDASHSGGVEAGGHTPRRGAACRPAAVAADVDLTSGAGIRLFPNALWRTKTNEKHGKRHIMQEAMRPKLDLRMVSNAVKHCRRRHGIIACNGSSANRNNSLTTSISHVGPENGNITLQQCSAGPFVRNTSTVLAGAQALF